MLKLPEIISIIEVSDCGRQTPNHELVGGTSTTRIDHWVLGVNHCEGTVESNVLNVNQQCFHYGGSGPTFIFLLLQSCARDHTDQGQDQSEG